MAPKKFALFAEKISKTAIFFITISNWLAKGSTRFTYVAAVTSYLVNLRIFVVPCVKIIKTLRIIAEFVIRNCWIRFRLLQLHVIIQNMKLNCVLIVLLN